MHIINLLLGSACVLLAFLFVGAVAFVLLASIFGGKKQAWHISTPWRESPEYLPSVSQVVFNDYTEFARYAQVSDSVSYCFQDDDDYEITLKVGLYMWKDGTIRNTPDSKTQDKRSI